MITQEQQTYMNESLEYERRRLDKFKDMFISAEPVSLSGNEAWKMYLKLKELEELREKNKKLLQIIENVRKTVSCTL